MPNTYADTYAAVGNREALLDDITMISPTETVFMSSIGKVLTDSVKDEWLTETLDASNSANAEVEGSSAAFASGDNTPRVRLYNYCQISRKPFSTSHSQDAANKAGIDGTEFEHKQMLKTKALAKDMNSALINQASASGTSSVARTLNGALAATTTNSADGGGVDIDEQGTVLPLLDSIWEAGGRPDAVFMRGNNKRIFSSWSTPITRNTDASGKTRIITVEVYESDFGVQKLFLEREIAKSSILIVELARWKTAAFRPLFFEELGKQGGGRRGLVESEYTLRYLAENSGGKITNTSIN